MLGRSPATGTPYNIHTETLPGVRFRRTTRSCPSAKTLGRAVQKQIRNSSSTVKSWKKIWLVRALFRHIGGSGGIFCETSITFCVHS